LTEEIIVEEEIEEEIEESLAISSPIKA
jgi:hypothetical protein